MSYSTSQQKTQNMTLAENHEIITIEVVSTDGDLIEKVTRVVFCDEGKRYVTYKKKQVQVKKMRQVHRRWPSHTVYMLKVMP